MLKLQAILDGGSVSLEFRTDDPSEAEENAEQMPAFECVSEVRVTDEPGWLNHCETQSRSRISNLGILRDQVDAVPQDDIDSHVAKVFELNRLNPAEKERIKLEVNFSLSRLVAHRLVKRRGDVFTRITRDGSTITKAALDAMDAELERKETKARRK